VVKHDSLSALVTNRCEFKFATIFGRDKVLFKFRDCHFRAPNSMGTVAEFDLMEY